MAVQDRIFSLAAKVLRVISLKNVLLWAVTALLAVTAYTVYEQRVVITNYILNGPEASLPQAASFVVSDTSRNRIKMLTDDNELVIAVVVLNTDIRNNRRVPIYWYSDDAQVAKSLDSLFGGRYGGSPLFTSDEKNNENIVSVINGEFQCASFEDGGNGALFPGLSSRFPFVCRTSLPPYYGQFSGYVTVALNRTPTQQELDAVKAETLNISTEIYFRDILPTSRQLPNAPKKP